MDGRWTLYAPEKDHAIKMDNVYATTDTPVITVNFNVQDTTQTPTPWKNPTFVPAEDHVPL